MNRVVLVTGAGGSIGPNSTKNGMAITCNNFGFTLQAFFTKRTLKYRPGETLLARIDAKFHPPIPDPMDRAATITPMNGVGPIIQSGMCVGLSSGILMHACI